MASKFMRILKHRWLDDRDTARALGRDALQRLETRVHASEGAHSGEIRLCVEAGLPWSYLWKGLSARDRAVTLFGKLRVWDTEANNGVLIYLLLAEQAIEIVADRALARRVSPAQWHDIISRMAPALAAKRFEDGLNQALADTTALLAQHFGNSGEAPTANNTLPARINELPDAPFQQ